jgi:hypothetical protein
MCLASLFLFISSPPLPFPSAKRGQCQQCPSMAGGGGMRGGAAAGPLASEHAPPR